MKKYVAAVALSALCSQPVLAMSDAPATGYTETQYPIVLAHGLFGFDDILGVDYWYRIPETLQEDGAQVYITEVSNSNSPEIRGEQLIQQIEDILAVTGADKVNLIGHSHGGPTTRYVASVRPDLVASITSVGGVNKGTPVADTLNNWSDNSAAFGWALENLGNALSVTIDTLAGAGYDQDLMASIASMTFAEAEAFNQRHPQGVPASACGEGDYEVNGVRYYSWTGAVAVTNVLDPLDLVTGGASLFFTGGEKNDGLVGVCSTHLGMVIRDDYRMNHMDEVNQTFGILGLKATDPLALFRTHANRLQRAGL